MQAVPGVAIQKRPLMRWLVKSVSALLRLLVAKLRSPKQLSEIRGLKWLTGWEDCIAVTGNTPGSWIVRWLAAMTQLPTSSVASQKVWQLCKPWGSVSSCTQEHGRNLLLTISDESLDEDNKLTGAEIGRIAWRHVDDVIDRWPNTAFAKDVRSYHEQRVLDEIRLSRENRDGKLSVLQLQTNINLRQIAKGGLTTMWRLAESSNPEIPPMLVDWFSGKTMTGNKAGASAGFRPNVILQDFIGHLNYREISALALAFNSANMTDHEVIKLFPCMALDILDARKALGFSEDRY